VKPGNNYDSQHQLSLLSLAPIATNCYVRSTHTMDIKPIKNKRDHKPTRVDEIPNRKRSLSLKMIRHSAMNSAYPLTY
jgi:hypothetical protein